MSNNPDAAQRLIWATVRSPGKRSATGVLVPTNTLKSFSIFLNVIGK